MKFNNPFRKKNQPINPGDYDWTFQFVHGGFVPNNALRKDKKYKAIVWLGGFKFKLINVRKGNEVIFFKSDEDLQYKTSVRFPYNPDLLIDSTTGHGHGIISNCAHDWQIQIGNVARPMICTKCGEFHHTTEL